MRYPAMILVGLYLILTVPGAVQAAEPPDVINYQGVLRDASDAPLGGSHDMVFTFYNAETGGDDIMRDEHKASTGDAVDVSGGLFNVQLGGGEIYDGSGPGTYLSLTEVFRDYGNVYMELSVGGETLSPRVRILSAGYALNAGSLDGASGGSFLRSDASDTYSSGTLTLSGGTILDVEGTLQANGSIRMDGDGPDGDQSLYFYDGGSATGESITWDDANERFMFSKKLVASRFDDRDDPNFFLDPHGTSYLNFLRMQGHVHHFNSDGPDQDIHLYFYDDGSPTNESIRWNHTDDQWVFSSDADVRGNLEANSLDIDFGARIGERLEVGTSTEDDKILFDSDKSLTWDLSDYRFEFDRDLAIAGVLQIGSVEESPTVYSKIGMGNPYTSAMNESGDLMVTCDFMTGNKVYVGTAIVVGDASPPEPQGFSSFGEVDGKDEAAISGPGDLFVAEDLEVDGWLYAGTRKSNTMYSHSDGHHYASIDYDNTTTGAEYRWYHDGLTNPDYQLAEIQEDGDLRIRGTLSETTTFDIAESFVAGEPLEPGDLVRIDPMRSDGVRKSMGASDRSVIGVVSTRPGILLGGAPLDTGSLRAVWGEAIHAEFAERLPQLVAELQGEQEDDLESIALERFCEERLVPVALAGRVPVKVDSSYGTISAGDALSPSPIPGVAMRSDGTGPVVGTALEAFHGGRGMVQAFVSYHPTGTGGEVAEIREEIDERTPDPETGIQSMPGNFQVVLDREGDDQARFSIFRDGRDGELDSEVFRVDEEGNVFAQGAFSPASMDVAEFFPVIGSVEPGDVLVASRSIAGSCEPVREAGDPAVIGVVAESPGVMLGRSLSRIASVDPVLARQLEDARLAGDREAEGRLWSELVERFLETHAAVAMTGTVDVKVDAGYGAIRVGDLLSGSPTPGHAMLAVDPEPGSVIGKALEPLESGTGTVRMLVMVR